MFGQHDEILDCTFVGPEEQYLALAPNESEIRILDIRTSACHVLPGHKDTVLCLDRMASGTWLGSGSKDHEARLWELDFEGEEFSYTCFAILKGHTGAVSAIGLPRKQNSAPGFVITGSDDRTVKCWDISTGRTTTPFTPRSMYTQKAHEKDINGIDVSVDDKLFASASQDRTVKIFNIEDGSVAGILKGHRRGVFSAKFSAAERTLVSGSGDGTVKLWSVVDFTCLKARLPLTLAYSRPSKATRMPYIKSFSCPGVDNWRAQPAMVW
jgi:U3 small nucleolar RNA-associated protein 13